MWMCFSTGSGSRVLVGEVWLYIWGSFWPWFSKLSLDLLTQYIIQPGLLLFCDRSTHDTVLGKGLQCIFHCVRRAEAHHVLNTLTVEGNHVLHVPIFLQTFIQESTVETRNSCTHFAHPGAVGKKKRSYWLSPCMHVFVCLFACTSEYHMSMGIAVWHLCCK
jgi:hypothetical protein